MLADEHYMSECLKLARKGLGRVSPNPLVGAILVNRGKVIATGYHKKFGAPHAEVNAIRSAKGSVRGATLYTNLEPCNYYGKTPPCTDLIIRSRISRVVIGMKDPNPLVAGKGIRQMKKAGIKTTVGILENECNQINETFSKFITTGLPFVALKIAQTIDGKISGWRGKPMLISNFESRRIVHTLRAHYDAVLVGTGTILHDDPLLTVRFVTGRNPVRVILDGRLNCNLNSNIFLPNLHGKTILFTSLQFSRRKRAKYRKLTKRGVSVVALQGKKDGTLSVREIMQELGGMGIASVMVEGGAKVFSEFLATKLVDKLVIFIAPRILGKGRLGAFVNGGREVAMNRISIKLVDNDTMITGYLEK